MRPIPGWKKRKYVPVEITIARTARHPNVVNMNGISQPHGLATMSTGGAAKGVSTPPIDTFTNSNPSVAYISRGDGRRS